MNEKSITDITSTINYLTYCISFYPENVQLELAKAVSLLSATLPNKDKS